MHTVTEGAPGSANRVRAHIAMLTMVAIWGINFSVVKHAFATVPPLAFNALRFPFAAAVVAIALRHRNLPLLPEPGDRLRILMLGLVGNIVYQLCFVFGLANTRASTASILLAGTPIVTAVLSRAAGHEHVSRRVWAGVLIACAGIVLVVGSGEVATPEGETLFGDVLMVLATIAWAVYTVGTRNPISRYGPVPVTAWTLWAGTIGIILVGLPDTLALDLAALSIKEWMAIAYAGAFSIGVAYVLWSYGVRHLGNTRTSAYSNLVPVLAVATAWVWLGERPTPGQLAGATIIILGVIVTQAERVRIPFMPRTPVP